MQQAAIADWSPHRLPYKRHRSEQTLLYQIIDRHYPEFRDVMAAQGKPLPLYVQQKMPITSNAADRSMVSCGCNATNVIMNTW